MKKLICSLMTLLLASSVIATSCYFVSAADSESYSVDQIAANTAELFFQWPNVTITNTKSLYDFNGKLIAYSVDVTNEETNKTGYEIISNVSTDDLVYEYCMDSTSPYDDASAHDTCLYYAPGSYYAKSAANNDYYDVARKADLDDSEVSDLKSESQNHSYISQDPSAAKSVRKRIGFPSNITMGNSFKKLSNLSNFSDNMFPLSTTTVKILSGVPDYYYYDGCAPTAAAMALAYIYPSKVPTDDYYELVDTLAGYMGTGTGTCATGATHDYNIPTGIVKTMAHYGVTTTTSFNATASDSTFTKYKTTIDLGTPLLVNVTSSSTYGTHSMCGVGYSTSLGSFIIVHDDSTDGNVYLNVNGSVMGTSHMWTYINKSAIY